MPKKSIVSAKCGPYKVKVLQVADPKNNGFWWAMQGSHHVFFTPGSFIHSGMQVNNVPSHDLFTYYGDGTDKPDNVANMDILLWLLRNRIEGIDQ